MMLPKKRNNEEQKLQTKVLARLRARGDLLCWRSENYTAKNAGLPDICMVKNGKFIGVELKSKKGKQSPAQKKWEHDIIKNGGKYLLARDVKTVDNFLDSNNRII